MPDPDHREPFSNGSALQIGMILGEIKNEGQRQTEIMLSMLDEQRELPDRLADRLKREGTEPRHAFVLRAFEWFERIKFLGPLLYLLTAMMAAAGVYVPVWVKELSEHLKGE
jgi:hypothetical protein